MTEVTQQLVEVGGLLECAACGGRIHNSDLTHASDCSEVAAMAKTAASYLAVAGPVPPDDEPPLPEGAFGRVELPGYRQHTGWITEETRFGVQMAVIRDWDGREMAAAVIGANSQVVYLPTPRKRPDPLLAIAEAMEDDDDDDGYPATCLDGEEPY